MQDPAGPAGPGCSRRSGREPVEGSCVVARASRPCVARPSRSCHKVQGQDALATKTGNPEATKAVIQRSPEPQRQADDQSICPCGPLDCHGAGLWKYRPKPDCEQVRGAGMTPSLPAETLFAPFRAASPGEIEGLELLFLLAVSGPNLSLHEFASQVRDSIARWSVA